MIYMSYYKREIALDRGTLYGLELRNSDLIYLTVTSMFIAIKKRLRIHLK